MTPSFIIAAFLISSVAGHSILTNIIVNGAVQTSCVRPHPSNKYDYPISDITNPAGLQSSAMTCGWTGKTANSASKCAVPAGSTVGFQWHYTDDVSDKSALAADTFFIDPSHKGPCLVYMAKSDTGAGPVWFKIFEDGYDATSKKFCVDKLRANKGVFEAKIPADLAPGNYLIRSELIALHEGFELGGAQPYVHCAEITVSGSGSSVPSTNLVSFPGAYKADDAGIYFNVYDGFKKYPIPGPAVYTAAAVTPSAPSTPVPTPATPTPTPVPVPSTPASSTTTTGKASTSSTGKSSTTTGKSSTSTSGRSSTTTTGKSTPAPAPTPAPVPVPTPTPVITTPPASSIGGAPCGHEGYMVCASTSTYQTCTRGVWAQPQMCQTGLRCSPSGDYVYCIR